APIPLQDASADHAQGGFEPSGAIDMDPKTGWAIGPQEGRSHVAVFRTTQPVAVPAGTVLTMVVAQNHGTQHTLGRFRFSVTADPGTVRASLTPDSIVDALQTAEGNRTPEQR